MNHRDLYTNLQWLSLDCHSPDSPSNAGCLATIACLSRLFISILPCGPSVGSWRGFSFPGLDAAAAPVTARDRGRRQRRTGAARTHVSATVRDVASGVAPHLMSRSSRPPRPQYTPVSSSEFIQAPQHVSSRSSYPTFLSLQETAWNGLFVRETIQMIYIEHNFKSQP